MQEICRYGIDSLNRIAWVDEGWREFAQANEAAHLCDADIIRQSLFHFVTDLDTVHLYRLLLDRVRDKGEAIILPFRCDSPTCRRDMVLRMTGAGHGYVDFESVMLRAEPRDYVALLDSKAQPSGGHFVKVCGWCKKVRVAEELWLEVEEAVGHVPFFTRNESPRVTHGMCPACLASVRARLAS